MKIPFTSLQIIRTKATPANLQGVSSYGGGWFRVLESYAGAWQRNVEITVDNVTTHTAVFACATLTASDIAKMRLRLVQQDKNGIWKEIEVAAFTPVLRKPNHYQNRIQFITSWILSKQLYGNTYVLKLRDQRRVVTGLYILDAARVTPYVAPNGDVYYALRKDDLSTVSNDVVVPASEIIHDRQNTLFHPLVGLSPIYACGLSAVHGLNISNASTKLFSNGANPGGVLTAPGHIPQDTADRLKEEFETNYSGENVGRIAVLGDGLKFEQMALTAVDAQLIEQLKLTSEHVCTAFHVPGYMVGVGAAPTYNNIEALNQQYYSQGLQIHVESAELALDEGLGLTTGDVAAQRYGTEFDVDDLLRMDTATRVKTAREAILGGLSPNEARLRYHDAGPVVGGDAVYLQQQMFSTEALAERDREKPFAKPVKVSAAPARPAELPASDGAKHTLEAFRKDLELEAA